MSVSVTGKTAVLGIIGDPVVQARAPGLINPLFAARGIDAVLVPLRVAAEDLAAAVAGLRAMGSIKGAIVTMPHKTAIMAHVDDAMPEARQCGACNVVRREVDGRIVGTMLDGEGFAEGLRVAGHAVAGRRIFMAGAGGAASAIAFALAKRGAAAILIHNRTEAKAQDLAARVHAAYPFVEVRSAGPSAAGCAIAINATSLGMAESDAPSFDPATLAPGTLAADVISHRAETAFLLEAKRRGCTIHPGVAMLEAQIALMVAFMLAP